MPRKLIRRWLPHHDTIREHHHLRWLGQHLHDPNLWHLNRRSISGAFFVGVFCAFIPLPFQMLIAAVGAIWLRVNLPLSVVLVWITNPLTFAPIFYATYKLGTLLLGTPIGKFAADTSLGWLYSEFQMIWQPLLLGSLLSGLICGLGSYVVIRTLWRVQIVRRIKARRRPPGR